MINIKDFGKFLSINLDEKTGEINYKEWNDCGIGSFSSHKKINFKDLFYDGNSLFHKHVIDELKTFSPGIYRSLYDKFFFKSNNAFVFLVNNHFISSLSNSQKIFYLKEKCSYKDIKLSFYPSSKASIVFVDKNGDLISNLDTLIDLTSSMMVVSENELVFRFYTIKMEVD